MPGSIAPIVKHQFFDASGDPLAGGLLFTYASGTTTKLESYSDSELTTANTNPIVLDSAGRATIFLSATSYKFVLAPADDTDPPTSPLWTVDAVSAVPTSSNSIDVEGTAGEPLSERNSVYVADGTGGTTAGRWYRTDASATATSTDVKNFGFVLTDAGTGEGCTIRMGGRVPGFSGLAAGSLYYMSETAGEITSVQPTIAQAIAVADTAQSVILLPVLSQANFPKTLPSPLPATSLANCTHVPLAQGDGQIPDAATPTSVANAVTNSYLMLRGGTVVNPYGILAAINVIVCNMTVAGTVTAVKGYRVGGTGATINARRKGTDNFLASALSLTNADQWMDGGAVQNTALAVGDKLEIMVASVAGSPTQVGVQIEITTEPA